jgi:hypothetical protein
VLRAGVSPEPAARLFAEDLEDIPLATVQALEQAVIAREVDDLLEYFDERAAILEYDAGLPRPEAELEAAKIAATLARNWRDLWHPCGRRWRDTPSCCPRCPTGPARSIPYPSARHGPRARGCQARPRLGQYCHHRGRDRGRPIPGLVRSAVEAWDARRRSDRHAAVLAILKAALCPRPAPR